MVAKKIKMSTHAGKSVSSQADEWVAKGAEPEASSKPDAKEPMKRLSLDLTATMHKELMVYCAQHDTKAADLLRRLIDKEIHK